jgi:hypothetical protein
VSELRNEILLRLSKVVAAGVVAALIYLVATGPGGVAGSFELALLCWVSAAAGLLLLESSPI